METHGSDVQADDQPAELERQGASPDLSIKELELSGRAKYALLGGGISTVSEALAALEEGDQALLDMKAFGPKSLAELKERLQEKGFRLPIEAAQPPQVRRAAPEAESPEEIPPAESSRQTSSASLKQRLVATVAQAREHFNVGAWLYGLIGILVIVVLLLPPVSLLERIGVTGYTVLDADNSSFSHPDGLTVSVDPETFVDHLQVRLDSVPRLEFLEGSAGAALRRAAEALPANLVVKSPFYQIWIRGNPSQPVTIDVVVPNAAEPWETLDLYAWTGDMWEWVGSELHTEAAGHEFVRAQVTNIPDSVVVVQAGPITPTASAYLGSDDNPSGAGALDEVNPTGLLLGTVGGFAGDVDRLRQPHEEAGCTVLPTLRNWAPGATVNRGLLSDLLKVPEIREAHIANTVQLCTQKGFDGVDVDYRGVAREERDAYSTFISALADALHAEGLRLTVAVEPPTPTDREWDTGGYDWAALGADADAVKVPFPEDPLAYAEGGEAHRLLDWATAQMSRYKLHMLVSSLSVDQTGGQVTYISLEQALDPFGKITALQGVDQVEPGAQVPLELSGTLLSITPHDAAGTYRLQYQIDDGETHTVWLGTAANLAAKLRWTQRYHLGGVAISNVLDPGNAEGVVDAVAGYETGASPPSEELEVAWIVSSAEATVDQQISPLTEPSYTWTAPATTGTYTISASIADVAHGSVAVTVAEPAPVVTETEEVTSTDEETGGEEGVVDGYLDASYVADVTIPDNTQLENGEEFEKTWRVRNSGTRAWPEETALAFSGGAQMDAPDSVEVGAVEAGEEVDLSVEMRAPAEPGVYEGIWRLKAPEGFFGTDLWVVIQAGEAPEEPPSPTPAPPAPPPVSGGAFELGGHVRDVGLPYADNMHYAGMTWAKVQVHYGQDASGIIAASHAKGFKIQLSALGTAGMVVQPGFEANFANWVAGLAAAGADAIEVWNEPNIDREWQGERISPQAYTNLLCTAYSAIKGANPGTTVISAAPAPTGWFSQAGGAKTSNCNDSVGCGYDDQPWMEGLYAAGAANCMDYMGAHHNSGATSPSARSGHPAGGTHHSWYFLPQTELYYNTFRGTRKLFYTEMGYASQEGLPTFSDQFSWARGTNNAQQAAWLAEAAQLSISTGLVRCIIVWNVDFPRYGYDPQDGYAIIRPDGSCPACESLHAVLGTR